MALDVSTLREMFRHLAAFRAVYEADQNVDTLTDPDGFEWSIHDLEYLYEQLTCLPPRQQQAIRLCLVENMKETEAAVRMGVSPTNPVAMYATSGLQNLLTKIQAGAFPRFRPEVQQREAG